jgi:DNA repair exonuclease SbcCD ATPase subunit
MGHVKLKRLSLRSFRSFIDSVSIDLPDYGLVLIRGKNLDTGGSSGSGKTSINLALAYAFGYCPYPATVLGSWGETKEPMQVEVEFECDEGRVVLTRGTKLSLDINGTKLTGSVKAIEDRLEKIVGLNSNLLALLTYRQQKKPGMFLSSTDAEKKEYLTTLLNLERYEAAVELSDELSVVIVPEPSPL